MNLPIYFIVDGFYVLYSFFMILRPLKNTLESRPTLIRVYRSLNIPFDYTKEQWCVLSDMVCSEYLKSTVKLVKVNQKSIFEDSKYKKKTVLYPADFIPTIILIIKKYNLILLSLRSKSKRKRISEKPYNLVGSSTKISAVKIQKNVHGL